MVEPSDALGEAPGAPVLSLALLERSASIEAETKRLNDELDQMRPEIQVRVEEHRVTADAIRALSHDDNVFKRAGRLVQVVRDESPLGGVVRPENAPRINILSSATVRERLAGAAKFMKWNKGEARAVPIHPPDWLVAQVEKRGDWDFIQPLENVIETPVVRPDGSVVGQCSSTGLGADATFERGYDHRTGLLFEPTAKYLPVDASPGWEEARNAATELLEVVADFPFREDIHRSAWLAGVLSPFARYAYSGPTPMFLADANTRGTGKSLLMDVTAALVIGRPMARLVKPDREEEWQKKITSIALAGDPLVLIDNVTGLLGGASLDTVLTGTEWSDRLLGGNEMVKLPLLMIWYATGNNVILGGDTVRRTVHIRLETPLERPEERSQFRHRDLLAWVAQERPRLVRAALTMLRAYCLAGRPDMDLPAWGSFDGWSRLIRHAIAWVGLSDPGLTRVILAEVSDSDVRILRLMLDGLEEMNPGERGLSVRDVLTRLEQSPNSFEKMRLALDEVAPASAGKGYDARRVGKAMQKFRRRFIGEKCIDRAGGASDGTGRWAVVGSREGKGVA